MKIKCAGGLLFTQQDYSLPDVSSLFKE